MKTIPFDIEKAKAGTKVVTRDGRSVRIICWDYNNMAPIIALVQDKGLATEGTRYYRNDGTEFSDNRDFDLLLVSEEEDVKSIEIPFGAKDSEFIKDEYYIPEGCEARIEGNKVIIERVKKEEESIFEKGLIEVLKTYKPDINPKGEFTRVCVNIDTKYLLDLARKELEENYYTKVLDDRMVFKSQLHNSDLQHAYEMGKEDALKDLPKWKRVKSSSVYPTIIDCINIPRLCYREYEIDIHQLIEKLPKQQDND